MLIVVFFVGQTHQEQDIYVAIPPPLISPLSRQAQGSGLGLHLLTPSSSTHSSSGPHWSSQDAAQTEGHEEPIREQQNTSSGAPLSPVSPTGISLPAQLLRLYPFSTMATPSTNVFCASSSSQESSRNANVLSSFGVGGRSSRQSYLPYSRRSDLNSNNNNNNGISSEQTRIAAVTAIANTLQQRDGRSFRGDSPYIPSSLSMLFSDPEVMQQELGREQLQDPQEQQSSAPRRYSRSRRPFRSRDHGQEDSDSSCVDGSDSEEEYEDEDEDEVRKFIRAKKGKGYGYEVVQDEPIFSYATMIREEYIAPHEPSSSSPLFPSPLTTLGRFAPGAILMPTDGNAFHLFLLHVSCFAQRPTPFFYLL